MSASCRSRYFASALLRDRVYLTTGGILEVNQAASVHGPRYVVKRGKTPVLSSEAARKLLDSIESNTLIGLRDCALIGTMVYSPPGVGCIYSIKWALVGHAREHRNQVALGCMLLFRWLSRLMLLTGFLVGLYVFGCTPL